ncbi:MHO_4530 family protein [[Mycoplasma] phocae]|nr:hypothetical protein [[Mycoplasma] phocae]
MQEVKIPEKYDVSFIILWLISIILIFVAAVFLIFIIAKKRYAKIQNSEGYISLTVDLKKSRIKINNDTAIKNADPWFFKKTNLSSGQWIKLSDFLNCLPKEIKEKIEGLIQAKKTEKIHFSIVDNKISQIESFIKLQINNFENDTANCFLEWKNFSVKDEKVFQEIADDTEYLFNSKNKYYAVAFILNVDNISRVENFMNLFKKICAFNEIFNIKPILQWNKLFFVFPSEIFSPNDARISIDQIVAIAKQYVKCYSHIVILNNQILNNINNEKLEMLFDYIKIKYMDEKQIKLIEINNELWEEEEFKSFENEYKNLENSINDLSLIDSEEIWFKTFSNKKIVSKKLSFRNKFLKLNNNNLNTTKTLDIYKNFILNFYSGIDKYKSNNTLVFVEDFILSYIGADKIIATSEKWKNLIQIVEFGNLNSSTKLKIALEKKLKNERVNLTLKINKINEPIINLISPWIKFVWIGKNITAKLSDPATLLLLNSLFKKAAQHNIKIVLEKLNYKLYKKVLHKYKENIIYTNID